MSNLWFKLGRGQRRPQQHVHLLAGVLIGRNVDVGNAIDVETVTLYILNNAHNGGPRPGSIFSEAHLAAERLAIRPIFTSRAFINDGHRLVAVLVAFGERATT